MKKKNKGKMVDFDRALTILSEQTENTECYFDHHGGCQAHGYLDLPQGEICGNLEAKKLLIKYGFWTED